MDDHPRVRASRICPLCDGPKAVGLVACQPCYHDLRPINPEAEALIDEREWMLDQPNFP